MFTIKRAAELVGVAPATLRAWERRYGVGAGRRTESGYRIYDEQAVRALSLMQALVAEGWSVRAAAEETLQRSSSTRSSSSLDRATPEGEWLVQAAETFDVLGLAAVLTDRLGSDFEGAVDGWLLPSLRSLGEAWESGRVTVAGEHLVAHGVARRLAAAYDAAGADRAGARVVLGLPAGSRHELGLLSFATAARRAGLLTTYLGADVPVADWTAAISAASADCAVVAVPMADDAGAVTETVAAIKDHHPDLLVAVGGRAQDLAPAECLRLGHEVGPAVDLLVSRLAQ